MNTSIEEYLKPQESAVLVIDMQNDFCHPQGHFGKQNLNLTYTHEMIPRLKWLVDKGRNRGVMIFHVRSYMDEKFLAPPMIARNKQLGRQKGICLKESWGAEFYEILPAENDVVLTKHAYSAFVGTNLKDRLSEKGIKSIMVTGVLTNVCCESTLRDGFMLGFFTFLVEDCCASIDKAAHLATVENVQKYFGWVVKSQDAIDYWESVRS
jgi:ureidoacrylate peracid hydrolase